MNLDKQLKKRLFIDPYVLTADKIAVALGFTPYDAANPAGYLATSGVNTLINNAFTVNEPGFITQAQADNRIATNVNGYQNATQVSSAITAAAYVLPTASTTTLGGVKIDGNTLVISNGILSATGFGNINGSGVPMSINSTNSTAAKLALKDAGATVGYLGASASYAALFYNSVATNIASIDQSGNFSSIANVTGYSDIRLKKNWKDISSTFEFIEALAKVLCGTYDRTDIELSQAGVSAQDMKAICEQFVLTGKDGFLQLAYGNAAMVSSVMNSRGIIDLRKICEEIRGDIRELQNQIVAK